MLLRRPLPEERGHKKQIRVSCFSYSSRPSECKRTTSKPLTLIRLIVPSGYGSLLIAPQQLTEAPIESAKHFTNILLQLEETKCSGVRNALIAVSSYDLKAVKHLRQEKKSPF
ncbi:hypothetical protein NPIL_493871 [Nephila pilipes]|uniref:Uncharacterized protein n=1 Tax=Nephila pilipes TaxID=299642 RepID=A0A8X6Q3S3_NEPPI|nr:hypothetical protein NPIL_493871 [Nephila pilipes]